MSIVTLNTQSLTFTMSFSALRDSPFTINFYTDGKGNVLTNAEDAGYIYVDCEKRTVWSNLLSNTLPSFSVVMDRLETNYPLVSQYIQAAKYHRAEASTIYEKLLESIPVVDVPMKTVFRIEQVFSRTPPGETDEVQFANSDQRTLTSYRMLGFTENGSIAPVYIRNVHRKDRHYQDLDECRYGIMAITYDYSDMYPVDTSNPTTRAATTLRDLVGGFGKTQLLSFRVRADGAIRVFPRHHASSKWLTKLEIPLDGEFVFVHGLEEVLKPAESPWDESIVFLPMELPHEQYYMRYMRPTLSGSLNVTNTVHSILFTLSNEGKPVYVTDRKLIPQGSTVYKLSSSMFKSRYRSMKGDGAEHEVRIIASKVTSKQYRGYYSCGGYIMSDDGRLTVDGSNATLHPITEMNPSVISAMLKSLSISEPNLFETITFRNLKA